MNKYIYLILCILFLTTGCSRPPKDVVASVDDEYITEEEYNPYKQELEKLSLGDIKFSSSETSAIEGLVDRKIVDREFKKAGFTFDESEFKNFKASYIEKTIGEDAYNEFSEYKSLNKNVLDDFLINKFKIDKLKEKFAKEFNLTDDNLRNEYQNKSAKYDSYKVQFIFMKDLEKMKENVLPMNYGLDILATLYSEEPVSASNGGIVDEYHIGEKEPKFDLTIQSLDRGETSDIVETKNGYYIIKLIDINSGFENHKEAVRNKLIDINFKHYMDNIRRNAKVKIYRDLTTE